MSCAPPTPGRAIPWARTASSSTRYSTKVITRPAHDRDLTDLLDQWWRTRRRVYDSAPVVGLWHWAWLTVQSFAATGHRCRRCRGGSPSYWDRPINHAGHSG